MGGGSVREGKNPPWHLGESMERTRLYGAHRDASGRGDGILPVRHSPVALRYPKSLPGGIVEYLGAPDVHTPLPAHPCVHVETSTYPCLGLQVYPDAYPGSQKPEIPKRKSLCDARAGITTRMRDNPLRACEGFYIPTMGVPPSVSPSTLACATSRSGQCTSSSPFPVGPGGCRSRRGRPCAPPSPPRPPCTCTRMPT